MLKNMVKRAVGIMGYSIVNSTASKNGIRKTRFRCQTLLQTWFVCLARPLRLSFLTWAHTMAM
jgi:hypothetical protein